MQVIQVISDFTVVCWHDRHRNSDSDIWFCPFKCCRNCVICTNSNCPGW